ncbi:hypothetical protein [Thiohalocapsa halophila]|jgi:hypothetical protein
MLVDANLLLYASLEDSGHLQSDNLPGLVRFAIRVGLVTAE